MTVHRSAGPPGDAHYRALRLLEIIAGMDQPATLPDIAAAAELSTASTYRVLRALHREGFLDHIGRSGYRVGARSVALASLMGPRPALVQRARPVLRHLAAAVEETATLHLRSGRWRTMILAVEPANNPDRRVVRQYERAPLASGCSALAILAHLRGDDADAIIAAHTPGSVQQRHIRGQLARVRTDGYALSFSANHQGLNGIAVALVDPDDNTALGALALAGSERRMTEARMRRQLAPRLVSAAADLAPRVAATLGPNSAARVEAADVVVQDLAGDLEAEQ